MTTNPSMKDVHELIASVRRDPRVNNRPVLGVNVLEAQRSSNGGFPMHMYHESLEPIQVLNSDEREAVEKLGYGSHYIRKDYPKMLFRRNTDPKFEADGFMESRTVATAEQHATLAKAKPPKDCGPWVASVADLEPLEDGPTEDPKVTIARMQGELAALRAQQQSEPQEPGKTKGK